MRGIRGAISVAEDTKEAICGATKELLYKIAEENQLILEDIASVLFTVTQDLAADFPAYAAREMGWTNIPLICMKEIEVPGSLPRCIRVLLHVNTAKVQAEMKHVYLREARALRSDLK